MTHTELVEIVKGAIDNEEVIAFFYAKPPGAAALLRTVSPYELSSDEQTFLGYDHLREALRRFDIGNILDMRVADEEYVRPIERN